MSIRTQDRRGRRFIAWGQPAFKRERCFLIRRYPTPSKLLSRMHTTGKKVIQTKIIKQIKQKNSRHSVTSGCLSEADSTLDCHAARRRLPMYQATRRVFEATSEGSSNGKNPSSDEDDKRISRTSVNISLQTFILTPAHLNKGHWRCTCIAKGQSFFS